MLRRGYLLVVLVLASCMGTGVNTAPVPELPPADVWMRGTEAQANRVSNEDEAEIVSNIVRDFFRPSRNQVRWISPIPLSSYNDRSTDAPVTADVDRADALVRAIGLPMVCRVGAQASECEGRPGGVLRFSPAYGVARDTALIYARYAPLGGGASSELQFRMARLPRGWQMVARRSVAPPKDTVNDPWRGVARTLLETDRSHAGAASDTDLVSALAAMFDDSVIVQVPAGFADGKPAAVAALRATPANTTSRITWTPIRAGVSADSLHGFTYGYMTMTRADSTRVPMKYLAYWINRGGQWKVLAYKRRPRPAGEVSTAMLPPALPAGAISQPIAYSLSSIASAEKEFSDSAQVMGIGPAFEKYGRPDAMNMGGPNDTAFVIGNKAVARSVGAGYTATGSPVHWAADHRAIVASSGDLGVTFGYIRPHTPPPAGQPQMFPFFTIWKRDPGGPWRYIAE